MTLFRTVFGLMAGFACLGFAAPMTRAAEPSLPTGLGGPSEPGLPPGLLGDPIDTKPTGFPADEETSALDVSGFLELRAGARLKDDRHEKAASIGEARLQIEVERASEPVTVRLVADLVADLVENRYPVKFEQGQGFIDLREANFIVRPVEFMDLKVGRQVLTWGTGDLLFINDLFPKDWKSFFSGRDDEYLKAPSDAAKASLFSKLANLDVVYTPRFDADRFIDGHRLSYFNPALGRLAGRDAIVRTDRPDDWFNDDELSLRLYRNFGAIETALYAYRGFWKSPVGLNPTSGRATFPRLAVYGASLRGPIAGGIGHGEFGYYDSRDDRAGSDPLVRNGEWRALVGFERELLPEFTLGIQYYLERMTDHKNFVAMLPPGLRAAHQNRHTVTVRLTKLAMNQNLILSAFNFWSPSDHDGHLRARATYKVTDTWLAEVGALVFYGRRRDSFLGQFRDNSNLFAALRRSF